jgi:hypothetical protein
VTSTDSTTTWWCTGGPRWSTAGLPPLLQRLAEVYLGPGIVFPGVDDPSLGYVVRITPERIGGVGPWAP